MKRGEARAVLGTLMAGFPSTKLDHASEELFVTQFEDFDSTEAAIGAVKGLMRSSRWFPSLAEIHEAYKLEYRRIRSDAVSDSRRVELEASEPSAADRKRVADEMRRVAASWGAM